MKLLYHYTIPIDPRTKKNHQMIAGSGAKCPVCHKPARQFVRQGTAHEKYHLQAEGFLNPRPPIPLDIPMWIRYEFHMETKRKVDALNLCACVDDLLTDAKIIKDDNSGIIVSHDGVRVSHDKEHPRTEIYIYEYDEKEDIYGKTADGICDEVSGSE